MWSTYFLQRTKNMLNMYHACVCITLVQQIIFRCNGDHKHFWWFIIFMNNASSFVKVILCMCKWQWPLHSMVRIVGQAPTLMNEWMVNIWEHVPFHLFLPLIPFWQTVPIQTLFGGDIFKVHELIITIILIISMILDMPKISPWYTQVIPRYAQDSTYII